MMLMPWKVFTRSIGLIRQANSDDFADLTRRMPELVG